MYSDTYIFERSLNLTLHVKWVRRVPTQGVFRLPSDKEDSGQSIMLRLGEELTAPVNKNIARYGILKRASGFNGFLARPKQRKKNMCS
jgi:hypothetical protein